MHAIQETVRRDRDDKVFGIYILVFTSRYLHLGCGVVCVLVKLTDSSRGPFSRAAL
jgi:hypothetical protein